MDPHATGKKLRPPFPKKQDWKRVSRGPKASARRRGRPHWCNLLFVKERQACPPHEPRLTNDAGMKITFPVYRPPSHSFRGATTETFRAIPPFGPENYETPPWSVAKQNPRTCLCRRSRKLPLSGSISQTIPLAEPSILNLLIKPLLPGSFAKYSLTFRSPTR